MLMSVLRILFKSIFVVTVDLFYLLNDLWYLDLWLLKDKIKLKIEVQEGIL